MSSRPPRLTFFERSAYFLLPGTQSPWQRAGWFLGGITGGSHRASLPWAGGALLQGTSLPFQQCGRLPATACIWELGRYPWLSIATAVVSLLPSCFWLLLFFNYINIQHLFQLFIRLTPMGMPCPVNATTDLRVSRLCLPLWPDWTLQWYIHPGAAD